MTDVAAEIAGGQVLSSAPMHDVPEITVEELKARRDRGERFTLVDVREPREWAVSDISGSLKIPLGSLAQSLDKLAQEDEIVVYCRSGARSANAVQFLAGHGYAGAKNLVGGINRWAERIDPSLPRY